MIEDSKARVIGNLISKGKNENITRGSIHFDISNTTEKVPHTSTSKRRKNNKKVPARENSEEEEPPHSKTQLDPMAVRDT